MLKNVCEAFRRNIILCTQMRTIRLYLLKNLQQLKIIYTLQLNLNNDEIKILVLVFGNVATY